MAGKLVDVDIAWWYGCFVVFCERNNCIINNIIQSYLLVDRDK